MEFFREFQTLIMQFLVLEKICEELLSLKSIPVIEKRAGEVGHLG